MDKFIEHQNQLVFLAVCAFIQNDGFSHFSINNLSGCGIGKKTLVKTLQRLEQLGKIINKTVNGYFKRYIIPNPKKCPEVVFDSRISFGIKSFILDCYYNLPSFKKTSIRLVVKTLHNGTVTKYKAQSNFNTTLKHNTGMDVFDYLSTMKNINKNPSDDKYEVVWSKNGYQLDTFYTQRREKYIEQNYNRRVNKLKKYGYSKYLLDKVASRVKKDGNVLRNELTIQDIEDVWESQKGLDYFTGEPLEGNIKMSIDRIDSNGIYEKSNIVITTWEINRMKNNLPNEQFISICTKITEHFQNQKSTKK